MADEAQSIRSLNWRELFPFINLFRAFRIAIHPSKLVLGFGLLFLVYCGGRVLDTFWPARSYAVWSEIDKYTEFKWSHIEGISFGDARDLQKEDNARQYRERLIPLADKKFINIDLKNMQHDEALDAARKGDFHSELQRAIVRDRNTKLAAADEQIEKEKKSINEDKNASELQKKDALKHLDEEREAIRLKANADTLREIAELDKITPRPLFDSFFEYESRQFHQIVSSALSWNWFNGISLGAGEQPPEAAGRHAEPIGDPNVGVIRCTANLTLIGPGWLLRYHTIYFILFAIWFLLIWAVFGGAIARIAAVHVSRDEKISVRQALRFSTSKLLSFVFAPVIPLIIMIGAGVLIAVGGLIMYIPVIGPIVGGALFILALLAGFVITLVGTGTVGGFNLMYPTIAVEGSDSFDAISRSFSYVFARPWRMVFYTVLSLVYGSLCFLFVRFFVYVMLSVTHFFASWFLVGQPRRYWPEIWPPVSDQDMAYRINFPALSWSDGVGAFLIAMWVYVVLTLLASFVISFYFSSNTIIYYLMRREVDATELDDVYVEETEEDFGEAAAAAPIAPAAPTTEVTPPPAAPPA